MAYIPAWDGMDEDIPTIGNAQFDRTKHVAYSPYGPAYRNKIGVSIDELAECDHTYAKWKKSRCLDVW